MKKDDIRRLLIEEKTGLGIELRGISTLICWFLLIDTALPQIPINGFCQLNSFPAIPGYKKFVVADVNNDSFNDYILYSSSQKSLNVIERIKDSTSLSYPVFSSYNFFAMIPVFKSNTGSAQFFFLDRRKRTAGLLNLSGRKSYVTSKIIFDSFPENIAVGDVNGDGISDYLISGSGFKGLSILKLKNNKLVETKIQNNSSYAGAAFADISNDGNPDVVAFNLFTNSLDIFYNDESGNFELIRSIPLQEDIRNLKTVRLNDEYDDIVYSSTRKINIIAGGFESAYDNVFSIATEYQPDRFVFSDFNNDKLKDIAYVDTTSGTLSLIFAKDENQYYPEIVYLQKKGLVDLKVIRKNYNNGLAVLSSSGEIFRITKLSSLPDETKIVPAVQPSAIVSFDFGNDGIDDICYLDNFNCTMNLLLSNYAGVPTYFYSTSISTDHNKIIVDDTEPFNKGFYCYSPGKKLLEIIDYDFKNKKSDSYQLYMPGVIKDMAVKTTGDLVHIYTAFEKNNICRIAEYEHHDLGYNYRAYSFEDTNVVKAKFFISDTPELYYWKTNKDSLFLFKAITNSKTTDYRKLGKLRKEIVNHSKDVNEYFFGDKNSALLTLFETDTGLHASLSTDSVFSFSTIIKDSYDINKGKTDLNIFDRSEQMYNESVIVYFPKLNAFEKIKAKIRKGKLFTEKLFDKKDVKDYVVQKKNNNNNYMIYTRQSEGFLSLKRLK